MLKWIGHLKGIECLYGIPARDMTDEEAEQYGGKKFLLKRGLWIEEASSVEEIGEEEDGPGQRGRRDRQNR